MILLIDAGAGGQSFLGEDISKVRPNWLQKLLPVVPLLT